MSINKKLTCEQAKQIDLVDYISSLGFDPDKIKGHNFWYRSPLRAEKEASFKIDRKINCWYDHGSGRGGTIIDFGTLYHNCSVSEFLKKLDLPFHQQKITIVSSVKKPDESKIELISETELSSLSLQRYLAQRRIDINIAQKYCRQVSFRMQQKMYTAIGFRNDAGGFELRNQWFKGSISPKTSTTDQKGGNELLVFEGFFDFLTHRTIHRNTPPSSHDTLVLNSTAFFERNKDFMDKYTTVRLYLDRDTNGQAITQKAIKWNERYVDESGLYKGYKDLNHWAQEIGKAQRKSLHLGP
ncbi:MAG: toprim domain-containing protein [Chitinophagaceae bacterium]